MCDLDPNSALHSHSPFFHLLSHPPPPPPPPEPKTSTQCESGSGSTLVQTGPSRVLWSPDPTHLVSQSPAARERTRARTRWSGARSARWRAERPKRGATRGGREWARPVRGRWFFIVNIFLKQDGAHEPECKHICQSTVYRKRHSRLDYLFHTPVRCWTSCAEDSTTKAACAGDFTTKLRLRHEGSSFCIQIKHWRKGSGRSTSRRKQWHCPKISKRST